MNAALKLAVVLFSFCAAFAAGADEFATSWTGKSPSQTRLILASAQFSGTGVNRAGVEIRLEDGWWTYWRAPGTSGMPPMFDWSGSENLADQPETIWPLPLRAVAYGESLNTYREQVVFPIEFRAADPTKPVKLHLKLLYGVCSSMCVPSQAEHELTLTPATGSANVNLQNASLIDSYSGRRPSPDPQATGMEIREVRTIVDDGKVALSIYMRSPIKGRAALVLVEGPDFLRVAELKPQGTEDGRAKLLTLKMGSGPKFRALKGKRILITVIDQGRALEQMWVVGTEGSSAAGLGLTPVSRRPNENPEP
ncbi:MAG: hypothetical protein K8S25_14780 [Alphaproteobacteria bacterium]|nr:hypothetical protein [Alphaproteobacteria bacterium]